MTASVTSLGATASVPCTATVACLQPEPTGSLLPMPAELASDPLSTLYYCESQQQTLSTSNGQAHVLGQEKIEAAAFQKEQDAIQKETNAASHKSFWDKVGADFTVVAKAAAVVASVAVAIVTCGAATPLAALAIAGAVLSTAGFADSEFHVLNKLGVSDKVAGALDAGMSAVGGLASLGAAYVAGVEVTLAAVAGGVATVGAGSAQVGSGLALRDADRAGADDAGAEAEQGEVQRSTQTTIQQMRDAADQSSAYLDTIVKTEQTQEATNVAAATSSQGAGS